MTDSPYFPENTDEPVGAVLARRRKSLKIPGQVLGERVGMSQAKISRLETGKSTPDPSDVRLIAEALALPDVEVDRLAALAERSSNQLVDWHSTEAGLQNRQNRVRHLETAVREVRTFQPAVVVGLLQTSEYARAILTALRTSLDDDEIADSALAVSEAVSTRLQRSEMLYEAGRSFTFIMTEAVLRNQVCPAADMVAQIGRLREVAQLPNVRLLIIPENVELSIAPFHGFELMGDRYVMVDLFNTTIGSDGRHTIRLYQRVFDTLEAMATSDIDTMLDAHQYRYIRMLPGAVA
ncbi:helix-turn-helix domain-containing protein [Paractinoplanes brasiliensis]|uniref:Helix-turn-helix protein n=1 Tax=Paractinoplanes brasiliensis TaxID=52695 RepID=A0A4R6JN68_9ACTN|nr:helix-turn-helix transcriptional regulator [Actinoplanes brasiliensis]TDO37854.1 helix-turn-helix protein [Actinoplanes brasiliensis]GID33007.1 transcriptional regulator [Actinoplanes brasiliensis]